MDCCSRGVRPAIATIATGVGQRRNKRAWNAALVAADRRPAWVVLLLPLLLLLLLLL